MSLLPKTCHQSFKGQVREKKTRWQCNVLDVSRIMTMVVLIYIHGQFHSGTRKCGFFSSSVDSTTLVRTSHCHRGSLNRYPNRFRSASRVAHHVLAMPPEASFGTAAGYIRWITIITKTHRCVRTIESWFRAPFSEGTKGTAGQILCARHFDAWCMKNTEAAALNDSVCATEPADW